MVTHRQEKSSIKLRPSSPRQGSSRWALPLEAGLLCLAASVGLHGLLLKLPIATPAPLPETALIVPPESMPVATLPAPADPPPKPAPPNAAPAPTKSAPAPAASAPPAPASVLAQAVTEAPAPEVADPAPADLAPVAPETVVPDSPEPADPYQDFPHLAGAAAGCQGNPTCWRSPAASWRSAANELRSQLESQGYILSDITEQLLGDDTGVRIYTVNRSGETVYYLNLVSVQDGILYTLAPEPMTEDAIAAIDKF